MSSSDATRLLRSAKNLKVVSNLSESGAPKTGVRYSPVENLLVVGAENGSMEFIDLDRAGQIDRVVVKEGLKIFPMRCTPDGERLLVVGRTEGSEILCAVYSARDRTLVASWSIPADESRWAQVSPATISPDGRLVATGHGDGVRFWSVKTPLEPTHVQMRALRQRRSNLCLDFSPDGNYLVAGAGLLEIIDVHAKRVIDQLIGHMQHGSAVRFSSDGKRLASAGSGKRDALKLWDFASRREIMTLVVEGIHNRQIEWSPDGNSILMMGDDSILSMRRVPSFDEIERRERQQDAENVGL